MKKIFLLLTSTLFVSLTCKNYQKSRPDEPVQTTEPSQQKTWEELTQGLLNEVKDKENELATRERKLKDFEDSLHWFVSKCTRIERNQCTDKNQSRAIAVEQISECRKLFRKTIKKNREYDSEIPELNHYNNYYKIYHSNKDYFHDKDNYIRNSLRCYLKAEYLKNKQDEWVLRQIFKFIGRFNAPIGYDEYFMDLMVTEQPEKYLGFINEHAESYNACAEILHAIIHRYETLLNKNPDEHLLEHYERFICGACKEMRFSLENHEDIGKSRFIQALKSKGLI